VTLEAHPLEAHRPTIHEVSVRELNRSTSQVLGMARDGARIIVTRHGEPIAVVLSVDQAIDLLLASSEEFVRMRMAAREELIG